MRIAFVVGKFPVVSETFIVNQICALIDRGHEITIFAFQEGDRSIVHESVSNYGLLDKLVTLQPEPRNRLKRIGSFFKLVVKKGSPYRLGKVMKALNFFKYGKNALSLHNFYKSQWFLRKGEFDVIHCHFASSGLYIARLKRNGLLGPEKLVTSIHGSDINPGKVNDYKERYPILFEEMDLITYNSEYTLGILKQVHPSEEKMRLLPVGLDTRKFVKSQADIASATKNILFCGRLVPFKGPDLAIEIVRKLIDRNNDVHLTMIGTGVLMETIKASIEEYGLGPYITLKGAVSQEEIIQAMDDSHIFLLPGIHEEETGRAENQGLVIQEAQAMMLPVVVSDAGGMKYGLLDGETGFVVPEKDIDGFVEKLEMLINDEILRDEMGSNGREYVVRNFDSEVLCKKLIQYYSEEKDI